MKQRSRHLGWATTKRANGVLQALPGGAKGFRVTCEQSEPEPGASRDNKRAPRGLTPCGEGGWDIPPKVLRRRG